MLTVCNIHWLSVLITIGLCPLLTLCSLSIVLAHYDQTLSSLVTSLLFGPMICLECSYMTSTNQSQSDVKFVMEECSRSSSRNSFGLMLWFSMLHMYKVHPPGFITVRKSLPYISDPLTVISCHGFITMVKKWHSIISNIHIRFLNIR